MKSILMSIQPKWCEKIINGKKTIEVRKTAPKAPFRAFIYCTKQRFPNKKYLYINETSVRSEYGVCDDWLKYDTDTLNINEGTPYQYETYFANGKIVGEFICDKVDLYVPMQKNYFIGNSDFYETCLTDEEINNYGKGKDLYGWHITALKIYDKPRELAEFYKPCKNLSRGARNCNNCDYSKFKWYGESTHIICRNTITRPPQSWRYIEEKK